MSGCRRERRTRTEKGVGVNPIDVGGAMRTTQQFSITLPHEMADAVKSKVAAGEYATEAK